MYLRMGPYLRLTRLLTVFALILGLSLRVGNVYGQAGTCSGETTLMGTLEEQIAVPACGAFTVGLVMKFKMVDSKTNSFYSCAMVILCPNVYGKDFFKLGKKYRFLCKGQAESSLKRYNEYIIINKYARLNLRTYVAQKVQRIVD